MVKIAKRTYFSGHHLESAAYFARQAKQIEKQSVGGTQFSLEHRGYVVGAVLGAVASLEAAINEISLMLQKFTPRSSFRDSIPR
jgi:hypothetical protein